jgi:putative nucleotidyltransferase with HDIG domain
MSRMEEIMASMGEIQPLPGTILRLIDVINDPKSAVHDIVETIRYDQALTTRMLGICNSAYFGLSREVQSLEDAMRYLGTIKVLQILMAVHTSALLSRGQEGYGLAPGVLWRQSVATALAATLFAERTHPANQSLTFTAGLLHDIGKVALNEYVTDEYTRIVRLVTERKMSFLDAEQQVLGVHSTEIGAHLGEKWKLPDSIVRCIRYHRTPGALDPPDVLVDTVYLANCVCMLCGIGLGSDGLAYPAEPAVMERYRLKESDLEVIGAQTWSDLQRVEALFAEDVKPEGRQKVQARVRLTADS